MKKTGLYLATVLALGSFSTSTFAEVENNSKLPLKEISKIAEVFSKIDSNYVDKVDNKELVLSALSGMVKSLDPYSTYLPKDELASFEDDVDGKMVGIGVVLSAHEKGLKIETVLKNGAAKDAGVQNGDIIIKVNDKYVIDEYDTPMSAIKDIKGEEGTKVTISVLGANKNIKDIEIERTKFTVPSVEVKLLDNKYGYIGLSVFQSNTYQDLKQKLIEFNNNNKNVEGFVLDLRSNPGGILSQAVSISDLFLDEGMIVSTKGRTEEDISESYAEFGDVLTGKPIVVLIDSGTASASEIVAGALQDHKRAIIVGETSYGKGSVQTIIPLKGTDGDAIKLTIARYYTPSGRSIQAEGIVPDIFVDRVKNVELYDVKAHREKDNSNHIKNDTDYKAKKQSKDEDEEHLTSSIDKDYTLYVGTNTLKTLIFNSK